jgi:superfamily II DNA or RNA helicase
MLAPGSRAIIRDEEWIVRRVDQTTDGGQVITCDGVSELVRDRTAKFLTKLEDDIHILDPAKTEIVRDTSDRYRATLLYVESLLRQTAPNDDRIHVAHRAAMDLVPYQVDPAVQALRQPRQRILIADAVGLGKTLEAGILISELIQRGRGKRILVLTLKSMLTQFQKEMWSRFSIPLTRLDSLGLQRVRSRIPTNHNPFHYYDKAIISIDTLKQDTEYRVYLEQAYWDIIVIDEAHNVADRGTGALRSRLAKLLAGRSDTLIMLSATPHDGRARSFASLMNMLDPTAIADPEHYAREDFSSKGLVVRRFKKDIQSQVPGEFRERRIERHRHPASAEEEAAYEALLAIPFTRSGARAEGRPGVLLRVSLEKALFSSPAACRVSVANRRGVLLGKEMNADVDAELAGLADLDAALARIAPERYAKYQALRDLLRSPGFGWNLAAADDRIVVFSERIETLRFLEQQLGDDLRLKANQITLLHGQMSDVDQQAVVEQFGKASAPLRVLLCSDVASEGINLHYQCHRLIHFDIPWSLMVFQQRNGRIDRYGQEQTPLIYYLVTESRHPVIRGDVRILEILQDKDDQAYRNIGDPSAFMKVYDVGAEEEITEAAIAEGTPAETFAAQLTPAPDEGEALLALFLGTAPVPATSAPVAPELPIAPAVTLYAGEYEFAREALAHLNEPVTQAAFSADDASRRIALVAPHDLRHRFELLPREIVPENWQFVLSSDVGAIRDEIVRCRQDESAWPKLDYLWPLHPVVSWLSDRMLAAFGRQRAPLALLPKGLERGEVVYVISGLIPNRKSHPLIHEWLGVSFRHGAFDRIEPFGQTVARTRLGTRPIPNRPGTLDLDAIQQHLPNAVARARAWVVERRDRFDADLQARLASQLAELERLQQLQVGQLELKASRIPIEAIRDSTRQRGTLEIEAVFDRYQQWVRDTLTTERAPHLQVVCVLAAAPGN